MNDRLIDQLAAAIATLAGSAAKASVTERVGRRFSSDLLRQMSRSLTLPEISVLLRAERVREEGLRHTRAGALEEGGALIADARVMTIGAQLSEEACCVAETFQLAAESYVKYRLDRYEDACSDLYGSMAASISLGRDCGYRMDYRVVHLARNLIHIENLLGSKTDALTHAMGLGQFVSGEADSWPFAHDVPWDHGVALDEDERRQAHDDVIGEIALAIAGDDRLLVGLTDAALAAMDPFLCAWLAAFRAFRQDEPDEFLRLTIAHCRTCAVTMPQITRLIRTCLDELVSRRDREAVEQPA